MHSERIVSVKKIGIMPTRDISVSNDKHRFYANGVCTSNSFNKSHAVAYGKLTFQAGWLKSHYFLEFMTELLNGEIGSAEPKLDSYLRECRVNGIRILPPDARIGNPFFQIEGRKSIRFGLSFIKGISEKSIMALHKVRNHCGSLTEMLAHDESGLLSKDVVSNLISVGAFDYTGKERASLLNAYYREEQKPNRKRPTQDGIKVLISKMRDQQKRKEAGVNLQKELTIEEIAEAERTYQYEGQAWSLEDKIKIEHELCKCYILNNPLSPFEDLIEDEGYRDIMDIVDGHFEKNEPVNLIAVLKTFTPHTIAKGKSAGKEMCFIEVFDSLMEMNCVIFPEVYEGLEDDLVENCVYVLTGKYDGESMMVMKIVPMMELRS